MACKEAYYGCILCASASAPPGLGKGLFTRPKISALISLQGIPVFDAANLYFNPPAFGH
ncbi:hypothetical protein BN1723_000894 [Verticillium longisporum]|uniref:Uncharacterized protein n=2 Tax=Verticillium longisporum TaxID=100787 RepID=A0A0G4NCQ1_VERLO|nr:hypothetical protein BN1723_000894 [Verticillium longisporum]